MTFLRRSAAALLLAVLAMPARAQDAVTFGTAGSLGDASAAIAIGIERGWFREAGIAARTVDFRGGAPAVQALVGGGITFCICAPEHAVRLRNRNVDGIIAFALDRRHTYALIVPQASPVRTLADLRGRRIGITSSGSLTENLVRLALGPVGLEVGRDAEVVGAGVGAAQKAALDTNRIAAGTFGNLDALQLARGPYRVLHDWRTEFVPSLALLARERWLTENAPLARRALRVVARSQAALLDDPALASETLRRLYPELPPDVVAEVVRGLPDRLSRDGLYAPAEIERLQADLVTVEPTIRVQLYETVVAARLLREVLADAR